MLPIQWTRLPNLHLYWNSTFELTLDKKTRWHAMLNKRWALCYDHANKCYSHGSTMTSKHTAIQYKIHCFEFQIIVHSFDGVIRKVANYGSEMDDWAEQWHRKLYATQGKRNWSFRHFEMVTKFGFDGLFEDNVVRYNKNHISWKNLQEVAILRHAKKWRIFRHGKNWRIFRHGKKLARNPIFFSKNQVTAPIFRVQYKYEQISGKKMVCVTIFIDMAHILGLRMSLQYFISHSIWYWPVLFRSIVNSRKWKLRPCIAYGNLFWLFQRQCLYCFESWLK